MAPEYADSNLLIWRTTDPPGLRLAGTVDADNHEALARCLHTTNGVGPPVRIDLTALTSCAPEAVALLLAHARRLPPGRRLVLHGNGPLTARLLAATDEVEGRGDGGRVRLTVLEGIGD